MKPNLLKAELSTILKNRKILIPIIAVMLVPVLYAGMFLWAFWDPYAKLDHLPVAIVNEDKGATLDGEKLKLGNDLVRKLENSKEFGFESVGKSDGYKKLKEQKYYMLIEIPNDFSENATTLMDDQPKKLTLTYVPNEGYNFLSAQIGGTAAEKIKTAVSEKVTETYAETIFSKITDLADGVEKASDGAGQLSDGSKELTQGSKDLYAGLATLAEKSIEFDNGMKTADAGSAKLADGSSKLSAGLSEVDSNLPKLVAGTKEAYAGAAQLKQELPAGIAKEINNQLSGSVVELNNGINSFESQLSTSLIEQMADQTAGQIYQQKQAMNQIAQSLLSSGKFTPSEVQSMMGPIIENQTMALVASGIPEQYAQQIIQAESKEQIKAIVKPIVSAKLTSNLGAGFDTFKTELSGKLTGATSGLEERIASQTNPYFDQLLSGIGTINQGQQALQAGVHQLYLGSNELNGGAGGLSTGMKQLTAGADAITSGAGQLADGSEQLKDGAGKLSDGAKELADKLKEGSDEAAKVHTDNKTYDMMAKPVKLDKESLNTVPNYGTGFAPYFLSLGLFVGALLLSIVFPIRDAAIRPANGFNWFASKFAIMAGIGIIQALIADAILLFGLNLEVQSMPKFILFSIITSLTFIALIQLLVSVLADAGRFIAIIILIFQLTTSAGTFPLELIPNFLQHFNAFLPMTYSVQGFKAVISSGDFSFMWENALILFGFIVGFSVLSIANYAMRMKHQFKAAHE